MSSNKGSGSDDASPSWAAESLPMSVRREMLERELSKLGFRKAEAQSGGGQQEQGASHPNAGVDSGDHAS